MSKSLMGWIVTVTVLVLVISFVPIVLAQGFTTITYTLDGTEATTTSLAEGTSLCTLGTRSGTFYYREVEFIVTVSGYYTFQDAFLYDPSLRDGFLNILSGAFDPSNPLSNCIAVFDDNDAPPYGVAVWLSAGTTYTIVQSSYANYVTGTFGYRVYGPGEIVSNPAPVIEVFQDGFTPIPNNTGKATFVGTQGTPIVSSIQIRNTGTTDLILSEPNLSGSGFTLLSSFGTTTVTPGNSTSFDVQCDAASAGSYMGSISFGTNDLSADPFTFALDCQVSALPTTSTPTATPTPSATPTDAPPPPAPPVPTCDEVGNESSAVVRAQAADSTVFCRVLVENGSFKGDPGQVGNLTLIQWGIVQAVDVFGLTAGGHPVVPFAQPVYVCLKGTGTLYYADASNAPRTYSEIASVEQDGFTCASISNAGTLVLVRGSA